MFLPTLTMYGGVQPNSHTVQQHGFRDCGIEQIKELSDMIDLYHRTFLTLEGEKKIEALRLLKGYATEFLSKVSANPRYVYKFKLHEVERVLKQSIAMIPGFDPREAMVAFEHLATYANNLLEQPWRPEFYQLKTTSGFFIHNVRAHLHNPQEILIVMGYVGTDDCTMVMPRAPDPIILTAISRDCFLASQECLLLSQLWERERSKSKDVPAALRNGSVLKGSTSGFKGLKYHQDLPKSSSTSSSSKNMSPIPGGQLTLSKVASDFDPDTVETEGSGIMDVNFSRLMLSNIHPDEPLVQLDEPDIGEELIPQKYSSTRSCNLPVVTLPNSWPTAAMGFTPIKSTMTPQLATPVKLQSPDPSTPPYTGYLRSPSPRKDITPSSSSSSIGGDSKGWRREARNVEGPSRSERVLSQASTKREALLIPWDCPHCTYSNEFSENICEICSKSKDFGLPST